ncbi:ankyrin repeat-containing domain protein [Kockovaella imperatae]|uniref:Ankyrin repeat-containing domain protein n=1 Tax=Kockovaella imperatae TaxID=4999 RepID=A0A1Y1UP92_9TREE|nr:ankyrin repeat-containing domain protein [Kockovaella imperatae]ORX39870.1 ankyrin repeat-containing domain protein [Kockovaella imperatae]
MVNASSSQKNIWVAASDGDFDRVKELIEDGFSPNEKDHNSYTPMHAAASYAHLELFEYLLSKGGNINLPDEDGETPLFTVETMEAARFLVEKGADVNWENEEGLVAADSLEEDHPEIAHYLRSLSSGDGEDGAVSVIDGQGANNVAIDQFADLHSSALMAEAQAVMEQAARDGVEPDEQLRAIIQRHVDAGRALGAATGGDATPQQTPGDEDASKRTRTGDEQ